MPVDARRLDEAHDRCRPLARAQATREEPVVAADSNWADLVLDPIVVHGQLPVIDEPRQRFSAPQAVVQRLGACRTLGHLIHHFPNYLPGPACCYRVHIVSLNLVFNINSLNLNT